jgi:hypothetical protein
VKKTKTDDVLAIHIGQPSGALRFMADFYPNPKHSTIVFADNQMKQRCYLKTTFWALLVMSTTAGWLKRRSALIA